MGSASAAVTQSVYFVRGGGYPGGDLYVTPSHRVTGQRKVINSSVMR